MTPADLEVQIRVSAAAAAVEGVADQVCALLGEHAGLELARRSRPYPYRPPREREARIYLTFAASAFDQERRKP